MKLLGNIPGTSSSFDEMLAGLSKSPHRLRLLQTCFTSGFFSDGVILSRLGYDEKKAVAKIHWDTLAADSRYGKSEPLGVGSTLPKYLGCRVETARTAGGDKTPLLLLEGGGLKVVVAAKPMMVLFDRHPSASWRMSGGPLYWKKPVVLVEKTGFEKGILLGAIATIPLNPEEEIENNKVLVRSKTRDQWCYVKADRT